MSEAFQAALAESLDQHVKKLQEQLAAALERADAAEKRELSLQEALRRVLAAGFNAGANLRSAYMEASREVLKESEVAAAEAHAALALTPAEVEKRWVSREACNGSIEAVTVAMQKTIDAARAEVEALRDQMEAAKDCGDVGNIDACGSCAACSQVTKADLVKKRADALAEVAALKAQVAAASAERDALVRAIIDSKASVDVDAVVLAARKAVR